MRALRVVASVITVCFLCACRSNYAMPGNPVILKSPQMESRARLLKVTVYSLACRGWQVKGYETNRIQATYRRIHIDLTLLPEGKLSVQHHNRALRRGHANALKRWLTALQPTINSVAKYDDKQLDNGLKAYGIDPVHIEKLFRKPTDRISQLPQSQRLAACYVE